MLVRIGTGNGSPAISKKETIVHLFKNRVVGFAAFALALGLASSQAYAQKATFTLPFEAHWGNAVLQPGEYTLQAPSATSALPVFSVTGNGKTILLASSNTAYETESKRNCLELVNINGAYFVRTFESGATGKSFAFVIPKSARHEAMANARGAVSVINAKTGN